MASQAVPPHAVEGLALVRGGPGGSLRACSPAAVHLLSLDTGAARLQPTAASRWRDGSIDARPPLTHLDPLPGQRGVVLVEGEGQTRCIAWQCEDARKVLAWMMDTVPAAGTGPTDAQWVLLASDVTEVWQARERAMLQALIHALPDPVWLKDTEGRFVAVNHAYARLADRPDPQALRGLTDADVWPPEVAQAFRADDLEIMRTGAVRQLEEHSPSPVKAPAALRWQETFKAPVRVAGVPVGTVGYARDITERRQIEERLRESEGNLQAFFHGVSDGLMVLGRRGRVLLSNRAMSSLTGWTASRLQGRSLGSLLPRGERGDARRLLKAVESGESVHWAGTLQGSDGRRIPVEAELSPGRWDAEPAVFVVARDLTEITASREQLSAVFRFSPLPMVLTTAIGGRLVRVNEAFTRIMGYPEDEVVGRTAFEIGVFADEGQRRRLREQLLREGRVDSMETPMRTRSGRVLRGLLTASWLRLPQGDLVLTQMVDVTDARMAEDALRNQGALMSAMLDALPLPVFYKDPQGLYLGCNRSFEALLGRKRSEIVGLSVFDLSPPEVAVRYRERDDELLRRGGDQHYEWSVLDANGERRDMVFHKATFQRADGSIGGLVGAMIDVTEARRAEAALREAASVFEHAREGILITSRDGTIVDVNAAFTRITGYSREEVLGRNPRLLQSGLHDADFYADMWRQLHTEGHWSQEVWNRRKDGSLVAELQTISAVRDAEGRVQRYVAIFSDITAIKEHQIELERIAHYDALTHLPNRVLLGDRMRQAMAQTRRQQQMLAVAFLDLDGFKGINDAHGHDVGDQLLAALAERMQHALRDGDTLARLGGDEFVAVLMGLGSQADIAPVIDRLMDAVAAPVEVGEHILKVTGSLGVTFYPQAEDVDADQLLRQADQAMYGAKQAGRNRYHFFDAEYDRSVRGLHESLERLRLALERGEFELHYQPKVHMRTGEVLGVEALLRWNSPENGLVSPGVFLPVMEGHPLSVEVGDWVLRTALDQAALWHRQGLSLSVSVNVDAVHLLQPDFLDRVREQLSRHPELPAHTLQIEVLETGALDDLARVASLIEACAGIGVGVALDDFGTGYSTLTYLKRLPAELLKIDQSFVRGMTEDLEYLAIVEGVLGLARAFRRAAIAEGVETEWHGCMLLWLGCEWGQGYAIARPMPAADVAGWVDAWRPPLVWAQCQTLEPLALGAVRGVVEHRAWVGAAVRFARGQGPDPGPATGAAPVCPLSAWLTGPGQVAYAWRPEAPEVARLHHRIHDTLAGLLSRRRAVVAGSTLSPDDPVPASADIEAMCSQLHRALVGLLSGPPPL